jgi:hypothetical protein
MAKFKVPLKKDSTFTSSITVEAEDEEAAADIAKTADTSKCEWEESWSDDPEVDDEEEIEEVSEDEEE